MATGVIFDQTERGAVRGLPGIAKVFETRLNQRSLLVFEAIWGRINMLDRFVRGALLAAAVTLGLSSAALAQAVQRSGATYHVPACPGPVAAGAARCHAHVVTDSRGNPLKGPPFGGASYTAADLQSAYGIKYDPATTPPGPVIAVVDAYGYPNAESDLAMYRSSMKLPPCGSGNGCFTKIDQTGGTAYPKYNLGWAQETALDLDMVSAICPTCRILLVEASSNSFADLAAAVATAGSAQYGAIAISNSYGGGETGSATYAPAYVNPNGVVTASTGDNGYGVSFPASAPTVTAVGGTTLKKVGAGWSESAWSGAGSGCSSVYDRPAFQNPAVADAVTSATCVKRAVADVSAVADPNTGVKVFGPTRSSGSQWLVFGGTSVGSPLIAGVYGVGVIDGVRPDVGNPYAAYSLGNVNPQLLNDVTTGSNGSCGGTALCTAGPAWDGPTGLGTPNGDAAF